MEKLPEYFAGLLTGMLSTVVESLIHNWIPLTLAVLTAAVMKAHVDPEKLKHVLMRKTRVSIPVAVAVGAFTPLCACGTMAIIVGMLTTTLPWGPIMAFLTSSPLMSPDGFIMLAGIVGMKFTLALTFASVFIGLGSGFATHAIETKTGFLKNQTRFEKKPAENGCACAEPVPVASSCGCSASAPLSEPGCCGATSEEDRGIGITAGKDVKRSEIPPSRSGVLSTFLMRLKLREITEAVVNVGLRQIVLFFSVFVAIGFLINEFVPSSVILALFSPRSIFSVPLAALIGLPLYVTGESAIPLINTLMAGGAGGGSMLAFMITGPATSAWVIAGISAFMKRNVIVLYIGFILAGGIITGYLYDLLLTFGL